MLQIKGNHLSVAGIKFVPPQNYCIDIEGMESISPDGLRLISPEEDCHICFMTSEIQFDTPVDSLMDIFLDNVLEAEPPENMFNSNGTGFIWIEKPQASEINGLKFAHVKYHTKYSYYYELHFARVAGTDRQLEILLEVPKEHSADIEKLLTKQNIKDFFGSFELDTV